MRDRIKNMPSLIALVAILSLVVTACGQGEGAKSEAEPTQSAKPIEQVDAPDLKTGGRFILRSHTGKILTDRDFQGQFLLVNFGYTTCPDVCPTTLLKLAEVDRLLGDDAAKMQVLFISVDPDRDTPEVLRSYVTSFDPAFVGLTGSKAAIGSVAKKYRVHYAFIDRDSDEDLDYSVDHTSSVFFMGPDGTYIGRFSYPTTAEQIAQRVRETMGAVEAQ